MEIVSFVLHGTLSGQCLLEVGEGLSENTKSGTSRLSAPKAYSA
jgi:hypothetical protein